jgi:hypothetical protein
MIGAFPTGTGMTGGAEIYLSVISGTGTVSAQASTVELSGGTASRVYTVTNRVTTAAGWIDDRSLTILVENR